MIPLFWIIPPFICLGQYFVTGAMVLMIPIFPWVLRALSIGLLVLGIVMLSFWRRTFCDRAFVGLDRPYLVKWSSDEVTFRGCFFDIIAPVERVTKWQVIGFRSAERWFMLRISVADEHGNIQALNLSTSMSNKRALLGFLDRAKRNRESADITRSSA